jgi:hypothetical protein
MAVFVKTNVLDKEDITSTGVFKNEIVREGLQLHYDVNNYYSWPNGGSSWNNLAATHSTLGINGGMGTSTFNGVKGWNMNADGAFLSGNYDGTQPNGMATYEAWLYPAASEVTSGDRGCVILVHGNCSQYMSWNKSSQYLSTYWYCSDSNGYHETNGPTPRKAWSHWCTVWDSRAGRLYQYVNGVASNVTVGIANTTNSGASGSNILIGREGSSRQFSGSIAEVRVYNRALTPSEVMQNFLAGKQKYYGPTAGLLSWLDAGNLGSYSGSGNSVTDLAGNGRGVTLYNGYSFDGGNEGSILFDGSGGMGIFNSSAPDMAWSADGSIGTQTMTIEMWVKSTDTGGLFYSKPWNGSGQYNILLGHDGITIYAGTTSTGMSFGRSISNNTWTHIVCWMNGTTMGYYINADQYKGSQSHGITGAAPTSGNGNTPACLFSLYPYGSWGGNTGFSINGYMGSCKVYNRVLSADEVGQAYRTQKARFGL